ncbi:MAG: alpha/beta fold hydrolase, partial [Gammaproteobacteria bacterium]|nr:alpha/beta fold hydrolase [Gammaproteobacteria bacterium]
FGADVGAFVDRLEFGLIVGVGHSMGGHAIVQAAASHPERFARLVLVDPVIMDPQVYQQSSHFAIKPEDHPTSKRKNDWSGWEEMYERFADRALLPCGAATCWRTTAALALSRTRTAPGSRWRARPWWRHPSMPSRPVAISASCSIASLSL